MKLAGQHCLLGLLALLVALHAHGKVLVRILKYNVK